MTPTNDVPSAVGDVFTGTEELTLTIAAPGVLANDWDIDGDSLSATLVLTPALGDLTLAADGSFFYSPTLNLAGWVTFTYAAFDGVLTNTAVVSIQLINTNDPPVVEAGALLTISEGAPTVFPGSYTDPDDAPPASIRWDFGDGNTLTGALTPTYTYLDNGLFTATLAVTDEAGVSDSDWLVVTVTNAAPSLSPISAPPVVYAGEPITVTATFTDPGLLDTHIARIDWEPNVFHTIYIETGVYEFTVSYTFAISGTYTVNVFVNDDDNGTGVIAFIVEVLEPPGYHVLLPLIQRQ
jgi:hypothetical protein